MSDSIEVQAEGAVDMPEIIQDLGPSADLTIPINKPVVTPIPAGIVAVKGNQTGVQNSKWVELTTFNISGTALLTWQDLTINPYNLGKTGESISKPYRRNLWVTGSKRSGYNKTLQVRVLLARPPTISATIQIRSSKNNSDSILVEAGGAGILDIVPRLHASKIRNRPRDYNSPYIHTDEAQCDLQWRVLSFNRTSDTADIRATVLVKPGNSIFQGPMKPRARNTNLIGLQESFAQLCLNL